MTTIRHLKFVPYALVEDYLRMGWLVLFPNAPMHHHAYGIEMAFICDCKVPGLPDRRPS